MKSLIMIGIMIVSICITTQSTSAYVQFFGAFKKTYISAHSPPEFKLLVNRAKCAICHDTTKKKPNGTSDKKFRNPYGMELDELLSKDDKKDKEKIYKALETISSKKAPDASKTYGERIKEYKLPCPMPVLQKTQYQYNGVVDGLYYERE